MKKVIRFLLLPGLVATVFPLWGDALKPFTTDGCSMFPEGTFEQQSLWAECCIRHDLAYWKGGSYAQKEAADQALYECVAKAGEPEIARLMLAGVRVGGSPFFPTSYRWGYGWSYQRGYAPLTPQELQQVEDKLRRLRIILEELDQVLQADHR